MSSGNHAMSDFRRLLSRRERRSRNASPNPSPRHGTHPPDVQPKKEESQFFGVFTADHATRKPDKEEEKKIKTLQKRFNNHEVQHITEAQAEFALRMKFANGDVDKGEDLLNLFQRSWEGLIVEPKTTVKMAGAENREKVTCYLDALLFAMFARLPAFQPMLYVDFSDDPRRKLSGLLRLWVNMLRSGILITTDVTKRLQEALSACGWDQAIELHQQDASEAFTFITDKLQLPLLTLKMDIFHDGKEEAQDDHKFVNERLLNVAIPNDAGPDGVISLEECLEHYFNNRIEVRRYLQRRNTLQANQNQEAGDSGKSSTTFIETKEVEALSPMPETPTTPTTPAYPTRPTVTRSRADSIFSQVTVDNKDSDQLSHQESLSKKSLHRRQSSIRTEVNMPAWQFFSLIPWYTDHAPTSDAQVAAHFSEERPILGICLKRYSYTDKGKTIKLDTRVIIPYEIPIPPFVSDDTLDANGPVFGNFKLVLQSAVCHRGLSPDSGHYISLVRARAPDAMSHDSDSATSSSSDAASEWMLFDDLAKERVRYVDIDQALEDETPYLLFYQVLPIDVDPNRPNPPTYTEATAGWADQPFKDIKDAALFESNRALDPTAEALPASTEPAISPGSENPDPGMNSSTPGPTSVRTSLELPNEAQLRGRTSLSDAKRSSFVDDASVVTEDPSLSGSVRTAPSTPLEDAKSGWLSLSRKGSKNGASNTAGSNGAFGRKAASRSRPTSADKDKDNRRLSITMSRLAGRMSRDKLKEQAPNLDAEGPLDGPPSSTEPRDPDALEMKKKQPPPTAPQPSITKQKEKQPKSKTHRHISKQHDSRNDLGDQKCRIM